jgi:hypothetical protein
LSREVGPGLGWSVSGKGGELDEKIKTWSHEDEKGYVL